MILCEARRHGSSSRGREEPVVVARAASEEVRRGHPWVWRSAVKSGIDRRRAGDVVELQSTERVTLGRGIADPDSPIAVRVWATSEGTASAKTPELDEDLIEARIDRALALRARMFEGGTTTAYRLLHGEGDRVPGFVVDRYGHVAVLRLDGAGAEGFADVFVPRLWTALARAGVTTLVRRESEARGGTAKVALLRGEEPPGTIEVRLVRGAIPEWKSLARGQKTRRSFPRSAGEPEARRGHREVDGGPARPESVLLRWGLFAPRCDRRRGKSDQCGHRGRGARDPLRQASSWQVSIRACTSSSRPMRSRSWRRRRRRRGRGTWSSTILRASHRAKRRLRARFKPIGRFTAPARTCSRRVGSCVRPRARATWTAERLPRRSTTRALGRSDLRLLRMDGPGEDHPYPPPPGPRERYLKFAVLA